LFHWQCQAARCPTSNAQQVHIPPRPGISRRGRPRATMLQFSSPSVHRLHPKSVRIVLRPSWSPRPCLSLSIDISRCWMSLSSVRALAFPLARAALRRPCAGTCLSNRLSSSAQLKIRPILVPWTSSAPVTPRGCRNISGNSTDQLVQWDDRIIADLTLIPIPPNGGTSLAIFVAEVSLLLIERVSEGREGSAGG
jgi:hypothetical protein